MTPRSDATLQTDPPPGLGAQAARAYGSGSRESRENQWVLEHLPLVHHIVQKVTAHLDARIEREDLVQAGTVGLIRAARAYDESRHAEFKTYAYIRIRGAVIDELRNRSFAPATIHRALRAIREAHDALAAELGRQPDDEQTAERAGLTLNRYYHVLEEARRQHFLSIHGLSDEGPALADLVPCDTSPSPAGQAERAELLRRMAQAVRDLPDRDRQVVLLYYERDLTMKEVAAVLGVTESRVSQMHAAALFKLSAKLRSAP